MLFRAHKGKIVQHLRIKACTVGVDYTSVVALVTLRCIREMLKVCNVLLNSPTPPLKYTGAETLTYVVGDRFVFYEQRVGQFTYVRLYGIGISDVC